eukprot:CAMPEP_0181092406 /NCGR_PEP_ID=MMETSP1071-20121207/8903_1 /TAXON_ID=35127 /ORGANISM="Thalassiosira sp., Strain NH16" /LENGTH=315 /DNA_ID=CAMNT_0023174587 /DNA_START=48 /DNA_END=992 /DNA_ORIENTATION=-
MTAASMDVDRTTAKTSQDSSSSSSDVDDAPPAFLASLPEPLRGHALRTLSPPPSSDDDAPGNAAAGGGGGASSSALDDLEISTRSHLLELVERLPSWSRCDGRENGDDDKNNASSSSSSSSSSSMETLMRYLKDVTLLCLHVAKHHSACAPNSSDSKNGGGDAEQLTDRSGRCYYSHLPTTSPIKKLPFQLLEDAIDSLPLPLVQTLWSSPYHPSLNVSGYASSLLCSPIIFGGPSKFVLLRICNKLLRALSNRDVDAGFAGGIMTMMARVFPLSERSAVNVLGSFNVRNETGFETREEFEGERSLGTEEGDDGG